MSIYKPCDIRGDAARELSPTLYAGWGRALGRQLPPMAKFVVGGDVRASTPQFLAALVDGLCQAGLDVVDLGRLPTPMIYYAKHRLHADGCAIVTASHNPAPINGLKWLLGDRPPTPNDVAALQRNGDTTAGNGGGRTMTAPRTVDVSFDYVACLQETFIESLGVQLHVVIDPMHGCWAEKARRYLHAIFPQCLFSTISDTADAQFGGRAPDCSRPHELVDLCEAVYRERAHLGIAFDGDGDRIALVDNEGVALSPEEATWVLLHCLGEELRGEKFVYDLKFSDRIVETARQLGAEPLVERSGHAFLRARMRESGAIFGAEISGHYFHRVLEGGDDGLYTACLLIEHLARSKRTLAELRRECPPIYATPDLRISAPLEQQPQIIEHVRAAWAKFPQQTVDGVRIQLPGGWALMRRSVTEPALTFRFEGLDWHALDDLVERFCDALPEFGDELWTRYRAAIGGEGQ
jgi:phosphomannomutase / phosphoglucomutase